MHEVHRQIEPNEKPVSTTFERLLPWAVAFGLLGVVLAIAGKNMIVDLDLFHEMALYRQMESESRMPTQDVFAYTPTIDLVVHHEWATGAVLYLVTVTTGWGATGLVALKYMLTFGVCVGCFFYARQQKTSLAVFTILAPIALNVGGWMAFTNIRAQLFTLLFMVILFFLLDLDRKGKKWWIAVWLPLFVLWANMHGGVVAGIGIFATYLFSRVIESWFETQSLKQTLRSVAHLIVVGAAMLLLLNVNPYGWDYTPYLIRAVRMKRPLIEEWAPLWASKSLDAPAFYLFSVFIAGYGIWCQGRKRIFESMALVLTAYLALKHYRHGSLYAVTWACFVPAMIEPTRIGESVRAIWKKRDRQIVVIAIAIGLVAVGFSIRARFWELRIPAQKTFVGESILTYPVGPVDYLADQHFTGNLFVPFNSGAFVSWKLYPDVRISVDSRYEVAFPPGAVEENVKFYHAIDGWRSTLMKYKTDAILMPNDCSLAKEFLAEKNRSDPPLDWVRVYVDREFSIYVPNTATNGMPIVDRSTEFIQGVFP